MKAKTFDDWKAAGYSVKRGEKASGRDAHNRATFTREQVEESKSFDLRLTPSEKDDLGIR